METRVKIILKVFLVIFTEFTDLRFVYFPAQNYFYKMTFTIVVILGTAAENHITVNHVKVLCVLCNPVKRGIPDVVNTLPHSTYVNSELNVLALIQFKESHYQGETETETLGKYNMKYFPQLGST